MQRVRFGLKLDGERGWHAIDALGASTVGPLGMLQLLETQLGLTRVSPSQAERVVQMRESLLAVRTGKRFYERSFGSDEMGTAATLLAWRDQWYEHGWDGLFPPSVSRRLLDMASIEERARHLVAPGIGQRLRELDLALATRTPQIHRIDLVDPLEALPLAWRRVLARLPVNQAEDLSSRANALPGTVLREMQEQLLLMRTGQPTRSVRWRDDGSLRIFRAESPLAAAQWNSSELSRAPLADRLFVIEQAGGMVDAAIGAADQALLGASQPSAFRPALQLLPLAARLVWEPLDFGALLQFLTHPINPIRGFARRRLAEKMASTPGIGGEAWAEALAKIDEHYGPSAAEVREEIRFWLEAKRFTTEQGAPLGFILERVDRLIGFFQRQLADDDALARAPAAAAYHQASALREALRTLMQQGMDRLASEALDRLVGQATSYGSDNAALRAQAGSRARIRDAGAAIDVFEEVCWWHMAAVPLSRPYPWSLPELKQLRDAGVALPEMATVLSRQADDWMRPLFAARDRMTLVLPQPGTEVHPIWLVVDSLLDGAQVIEVESLLSRQPVPTGTSAVPLRPLPARRRWWQLAPGSIDNSTRPASFSSLEQFIFNPYQWVLQYPAQLRPSALLDVPGDFRLLGTLAHRVVERLYCHPDALTWSGEQVEIWFAGAFDQIVREEGALLLMSGRRADLESFRQRFRRSMRVLHGQLQSAGVVKVVPELQVAENTPVGELRGIVDLLVESRDGRQAIIDMKWAGNKKYREKLESQSHLQLAIYARLIERNTSNWPTVSYFILSRPELLTSGADFFPGVTPVGPPGNVTAQLWERVMSSWRWREAQIARGAIEVVVEGTEPTEDSKTPDNGVATEVLDARYNPFRYLAGWSDEA